MKTARRKAPRSSAASRAGPPPRPAAAVGRKRRPATKRGASETDLVPGSWRGLPRALPDLVMRVDKRGGVLSVNRDERELPVARRVGASLFDSIPREDHAALQASLATVFSTGRPSRFEARGFGPDAATWHECRLAPLTRRGRVSSAILVATDISARKRAELALADAYQELEARVRERTRALAQANERFRALVENMPAVTYVAEADEAAATLYISPQIAGISGFDPGEWTSDTALWPRRMHPDDRERVRAEWAESVRTGSPFRSMYRWLAKDGRVVWWVDEARPVRQGGRAVLHGFIRDVTAEEAEAERRREAEQALRRSEERYRALFERNLAGMYRSTLAGHILECNPAFARVYGYDSPAELRGVDAAALYAGPDDRGHFISRLLRERALVNYESTGRRRDGSLFPLLEAVSLVEHGGGGPPLLEGVVLDLSERKRGEALLEGQAGVLEMIARKAPLSDVLEAIAVLSEAQSAGMLCSVLLVDEKSQTLRHGAAPSLPRSYWEAIDGVPVGPSSGSCGTAACRRETVIVADVASDPLATDYREIALRHGLRACWSTPVISEAGRVLGFFAMYFREPRVPSRAELQLGQVASRLTALAIERYRAEEALQIHKRQLLEAQRIGGLGSWEWDVTRDEITCSDELYRTFGIPPPATALRFQDFLVSLHRDDRAHVEETVEKALREGQPFEMLHRIFRRDRSVRVIHARGEAACDPSGRVIRLFGVGQDITERTWSEKRLSRNLDRLQRLFEITAAVNRGAEAREVHELALDALVYGIGADRAAILMHDASGVARFVASRGLSQAYRQAVEGHSPWAGVVGEPEPIVIPDVAEAPDLGPLRAAVLAEGIRGLVFLPIFKDRLLGKFMLYYDAPCTPDEEEIHFALTLARNIGQATQRGRAEQALSASHDRMRRLAEHLQQAREDERARIAREIHDELGQTLTALKLDLSWLKGRLLRRPELAARVAETSGLTDAAIKTVRRISTALRPGVLDDLGLVAAVEWLAHDVEARTGIRCRLEPPFEDLDVGPEASTHIFRLFQEALTNVVRHSGASEVQLRLARQGKELHGEIRDNGRGIAKQQLADMKTLGLIGMRERARLLGGDVEFGGGPGTGTLVQFRCPLGSARLREARAT